MEKLTALRQMNAGATQWELATRTPTVVKSSWVPRTHLGLTNESWIQETSQSWAHQGSSSSEGTTHSSLSMTKEKLILPKILRLLLRTTASKTFFAHSLMVSSSKLAKRLRQPKVSYLKALRIFVSNHTNLVNNVSKLILEIFQDKISKGSSGFIGLCSILLYALQICRAKWISYFVCLFIFFF